MKVIETDRLVLREFTQDDTEFIFELLNSPGWLQFIGDRGIKSIDDAKKYIREKLVPSYHTNGFGLYKIELKSGSLSIGMCGLVKREGLDDIDIGFALLPEFGGKGFAFEGAIATVKYANDFLKLKRLVAITIPANKNSVSLLKKLNFMFEKMIQMPGDKNELMLFSLNF